MMRDKWKESKILLPVALITGILFMFTAVDLQAEQLAEKEPNNTILQPGPFSIGPTMAGAIEAKDTDYYTFTCENKVIDWIKIELVNRSTTLKPGLTLYNGKKSQLTYHYQNTAGADLSFNHIAAPGEVFYLQVYNRGNTTGKYHLKITAQKAFDSFEPNDQAFDATGIELAKAVTANIMYGKDVDFFKVNTSKSGGKKVMVSVENGSTTLRPGVTIFNRKKAQVTYTYENTAGADLEMSFDCVPGEKYYIQVYSRGDSTGKYRLAVKQ